MYLYIYLFQCGFVVIFVINISPEALQSPRKLQERDSRPLTETRYELCMDIMQYYQLLGSELQSVRHNEREVEHNKSREVEQ